MAAASRGFSLALAVALVGCGGGSSTPGGPVPLAQLPSMWAHTVCAQNFKCASKADIMMRTKSDCIETNMNGLMFLTASVQDGQAKGRVMYVAAKAGACLATLAHETCEEWNTGLFHEVGCPEAFTPAVAIGGACQNDVECIGGFCDGADSSADPPVDGACKARVAHGGACTFADTCVATDYCDGTARMCTAKKAGGAACTSDDECGNSCNADTDQCSGYAGCAVAPTGRGTVLSIVGLGLVVSLARRRRSAQR
jgi:hypothetical protein